MRGFGSPSPSGSRPRAQQLHALDPDQSRTVLSVPLHEILRIGYLVGPGAPARPTWRWDWPLRSAPPTSPIHRLRADGHAKAVFWVEVEAGGETLHSQRVVLEVSDFHNQVIPTIESPSPRSRASLGPVPGSVTPVSTSRPP